MAGMVCSWVYCNVKVLDKKQNAKPKPSDVSEGFKPPTRHAFVLS